MILARLSLPTLILLAAAITLLLVTPANGFALPETSANATEWKPGDRVEVLWTVNQQWYKAQIIEAKEGQYKIRYEGYTGDTDEWVERKRIRPVDPNAQAGEWTWSDGTGQVRTAADLNQLLEQHRLWLVSEGRDGKPANLSNAKLPALKMSGINLAKAILTNADLSGAELLLADLREANLEAANLSNAKIVGAQLQKAKLRGASLMGAEISPSFLDGADLTAAVLVNANLSDSLMKGVNLHRAVLHSAKLNNCLLDDADLSLAGILGTDLSGAKLYYAELKGAFFEPSQAPELMGIANAYNLEHLSYVRSPSALSALREAFVKEGYATQQSELTYALKRKENELRLERARDTPCQDPNCTREKRAGRECDNGVCEGRWRYYLYYVLNLVFFDWTVRYGMEPEHALVVLIYVWLIFSFIFYLFIHFPGRSGLFLIKERMRRNISHYGRVRYRPRPVKSTTKKKYLWYWLRREWRALRVGMFFSLLNTFSTGFRDFDPGTWIRALTKREYRLEPKHWTRTIAGAQSLMSLYLFAIWVLTQFGHPFE